MSCLFSSHIGRFIRDTYRPTIKNCLLRNCSAFTKILPNDTVPNLPNSPSYRHKPVFVKEVVNIINPAGGQVVLDMTFGGGGHTKALLKVCPDLVIYALDRDPVAHNNAKELAATCHQVKPLLGCFSEVGCLLESQYGVKNVDAIILDAGASSMQLDNASRGFSLSKDGPLDMRMDGDRTKDHVTAADVVNNLNEYDLYTIIRKYGEEKHAKLIARAIVDNRYAFGPITSTARLADIVATVYQGSFKRDKLNRPAHPATKTFQALRIFVNNELNELYSALDVAHSILNVGGVCVAITFHSLEDRIVKRHFHGIDMDAKFNMSVSDRYRNPSFVSDQSEVERLLVKKWEPLDKKVLVPSDVEVADNPRARSAKLRAAYKLTDSGIRHPITNI